MDFIFLGSKITADGDCSHEIKRRLHLWKKAMTNLDSSLKSRDITLLTKVCIHACWGFLGSSASKESACNAGDSGLIPGLGISPGEGIGYPLQYSWASLKAQMVKNPHAMWETWVRSLIGKIPWRRAWQPTSVFLSGESQWTEKPGELQSVGSQRVRHDWVTKHSIAPCLLGFPGGASGKEFTFQCRRRKR